MGVGNQCYFQVPGGSLDLSRELDTKSAQPDKALLIEDILQMEQDQFLGTTTDVQGVYENLIYPSFHDAGMVEFWAQHTHWCLQQAGWENEMGT
jgi:hypothetical protein